MIDGNLARAIAADALALGNDVVELGAGGGALTGPLLAGGARVLAVEIDADLTRLLRAEYGQHSQLTLRQQDIARLAWAEILVEAGSRPVVAGNLPYGLTSEVLFALAEHQRRLAGAVLMIQREVAERLAAEPGGRDYGVLAVLLGSLFAVEVRRTVPPAVFWPQPDVSSAVVKLTPRESWPDAEWRGFQAVVKACFAQRRKKMSSILRDRFGLSDERVASRAAAALCDLDRRPEQIDRITWRRLAGAIGGESAS